MDEQELEMLRRNCALRRPNWDTYELNEYITMLTRIDDRSLKSEIEELGKKICQNAARNCLWRSAALAVIWSVGILLMARFKVEHINLSGSVFDLIHYDAE
ncbi:hypothetical protein [Morganella morganii]|uniref:hypothetical protein n=1 Tax=Morganella morganii TaxID=582 RepID=UPI0029316CF6|nr:hypothetical protein [Morganella morganii]